MPEVSSTPAIISISGLAKIFFSKSSTENSTCIWPDEASQVSKCGKPASSGASLISHAVEHRPENRECTAGMKNTAQVASTVASADAKMHFSQLPPAFAFVMATIVAAPVEREIHADGNQRAENRAEDAALAHMKPVGLDLDDGHRAVALKIHVDGVKQRKRDDEVHLPMFHDDEPGQNPSAMLASDAPSAAMMMPFLPPSFLSMSGPLTRNDSA